MKKKETKKQKTTNQTNQKTGGILTKKSRVGLLINNETPLEKIETFPVE